MPEPAEVSADGRLIEDDVELPDHTIVRWRLESQRE
jgi:hypothetical protein